MGVWDEMYQEAMELGRQRSTVSAVKRAIRKERERIVMRLLKYGERSIDKISRYSGMRRDSVQKFAAKNGYLDLV